MVFVDPESTEGAWLCASLQQGGMAPSVLMRGDFIEIPLPFSAFAAESDGRRPRPTE